MPYLCWKLRKTEVINRGMSIIYHPNSIKKNLAFIISRKQRYDYVLLWLQVVVVFTLSFLRGIFELLFLVGQSGGVFFAVFTFHFTLENCKQTKCLFVCLYAWKTLSDFDCYKLEFILSLMSIIVVISKLLLFEFSFYLSFVPVILMYPRVRMIFQQYRIMERQYPSI